VTERFHAPALRRMDDVEVCAVVDQDGERRQRIARRFPRTEACGSVAELPAGTEADAPLAISGVELTVDRAMATVKAVCRRVLPNWALARLRLAKVRRIVMGYQPHDVRHGYGGIGLAVRLADPLAEGARRAVHRRGGLRVSSARVRAGRRGTERLAAEPVACGDWSPLLIAVQSDDESSPSTGSANQFYVHATENHFGR